MSQQINLFNPIFLRQKKMFTSGQMVQTLGLILIGALALVAFGHYRTAQLEDEVAASKAALAASEGRLAHARAEFVPRKKSEQVAEELASAQADLAAMREAQNILQRGSLGNTEGYAEYFRAFARQNVHGLWLTGIAISGAGTDIAVQGRAMQATLVPGYIARLTQEPVMHGKTFGSLQMGRPEAMAAMTGAPGAAAQPSAQGGAAATGASGPGSASGSAPAAAPFVEFSLQSQPAEAAK